MRAIVLLLLALVAFASAVEQDQPLARVAHYEPVNDFKLNEAQDGLSFKAFGRQWQFEVWRSGVSTESKDDGYHFQGHLKGESKAKASFTVSPSWTSGMILMNNDTLWLEATNPAQPDTLFIYKSSDVHFRPEAMFGCGHAGEQHRREEPMADQTQRDKRGIVSTRVFTDQYWVSPQYNPYFYTRDATLALLNDVNVVYFYAGLNYFAFTLTDPPATYTLSNAYTANSQLPNMLNDFSIWATYGVGVTPYYNSVIWLVGNNVGGLAWLSSACGAHGNYYKTAVAGLSYFSRLYTVKTIAHELGHNRGANHDFAYQCAQGQSGGCQCSVMSYCLPEASTAGGAVNYFSGTSVGEIARTCN